MITNLLFLILVGSMVGIAAGYLGSFMVLKRMSLVGDALTHVALPGMAIALTFNFSPTLGAFLALTLAVIGVWYLEKTSSIYPETLMGIFFTASLAIGLLITPEPELLEALFGNLEKVTTTEGILTVIVSLLFIFFTWLISKKLLMGIVSEELAKSMNISISKYNLFYLLLVGGVVALGVKFVGTLLMGALVIVPAASAKNISRGIKDYYLFSALFGLLSAVIGLTLASILHISSGPAVVLTSISFFIITYIFKK
jgi:ABC-type Mn2+/Zn2+ transport system permease subunit